MKKLLTLFLLLPFLSSANVGHITTNLTAGLAVIEGNYLSFGDMVVIGASTVTVSANGVRTTTGNVSLSNEVFSPQNLTIKGTTLANFVLTLPTSATITNGKTTLQVKDFTSTLTGGVGQINSQGYAIVSIGATIYIVDGFSTGVYNGTYEYQINYQ